MLLFKCGDWKVSALLSSVCFPSYVFLVFGISDIIELKAKSVSGVYVMSSMKYLTLWVIINSQLSIIGAYRGYKTPLAVDPIINEADKQIPEQPFHLRWYVTVPALGSVPFILFHYSVKYLLDSIWRSNLIYAMFGILLAKMILLCFAISTVSIV